MTRITPALPDITPAERRDAERWFYSAKAVIEYERDSIRHGCGGKAGQAIARRRLESACRQIARFGRKIGKGVGG